MRVEERLRGLVRAEIVGPEPAALLNACLAEDLPLRRPELLDRFTLRLSVYERDLPRLRELSAAHNCQLRELYRRGGSRTRRLLRRRLPLLLAASLLLILLFASSLFVWEIRLVGAESLSRGELLRGLEDCGLRIGCFSPCLDVEALRDRMLLREGRLVWLTVNIRGSVAEVRLLAREEKTEPVGDKGPADLVASRAGIVRQLSVLNGRPAVSPGQTVAAGELLIAGGMQTLGGETLPGRAQGEVWADTWYELTSVCPPTSAKESDGGARSRFALTVGGKRINFYQKSGKTIDAYDTIIQEYSLGVEGLFSLPLGFVREELRPYRCADRDYDSAEEIGQRLLATLAERIEGEIVSFQISASRVGGATVVTLRAQCRENIAREAAFTP